MLYTIKDLVVLKLTEVMFKFRNKIKERNTTSSLYKVFGMYYINFRCTKHHGS